MFLFAARVDAILSISVVYSSSSTTLAARARCVGWGGDETYVPTLCALPFKKFVTH
jgi:hypothetical protein